MQNIAHTHDLIDSDPVITSGDDVLPLQTALQIHRVMVRTRVMEERMIKMSKSGEGYFWIGGPGEEAFNACLGLQVNRGAGPNHDYLHLHYRSSAVMVAMGMPLIDAIRQMAMRITDPFSMGRNFVGHFSRPDWNVVPVTSVVEIQYAMAAGTAIVQKRSGGEGITIVVGGDAGTAEGDFATAMVWSTRPDNQLPILMVVTHNNWGISTAACTQHGEKQILDRGEPFGIPGLVFDGNDAIKGWHAVRRAMAFCRTKGRPCILEPIVSRLYGHSSSSGALRVKNEPDCIELLEQKLVQSGLVTADQLRSVHEDAVAEVKAAVEQAMAEANPKPSDVQRFTYAPSKVDRVYPNDYTGLPM
ncbi:2-oxoisovalerate dehydrogenase subunit alpha [Stieleria maiorica]|uniref:2-oxoisovalerate dehydrogenase subunit alpha n=1 Tax=Stieleria maiorica TaxID=2795974 RepID=A0A5B9MKW9_9BACT|nr:thiamine pyrophosphate-dependent enzyme [Stieleria maiorica]QEG01574.1 2-oxoisovalerate dehydrogenase subunit alpha [Stieleria maiorica]